MIDVIDVTCLLSIRSMRRAPGNVSSSLLPYPIGSFQRPCEERHFARASRPVREGTPDMGDDHRARGLLNDVDVPVPQQAGPVEQFLDSEDVTLRGAEARPAALRRDLAAGGGVLVDRKDALGGLLDGQPNPLLDSI
ncbi:hypothetical protein [Streptomyces sp. c-19]|uniref:hypothetical protein n=1 Tax=Streptomyces sp. c-19 TaxID=2789275 RepID=UPI00397F41AF